jgi:hypothetical protein
MCLKCIVEDLYNSNKALYDNLRGWETGKIFHNVESKFVDPYVTEFIDLELLNKMMEEELEGDDICQD